MVDLFDDSNIEERARTEEGCACYGLAIVTTHHTPTDAGSIPSQGAREDGGGYPLLLPRDQTNPLVLLDHGQHRPRGECSHGS